MRDTDERSGPLFSYAGLEARAHSLRASRAIVNRTRADLIAEFGTMCSPLERPSIPPEDLLGTLNLPPILDHSRWKFPLQAGRAAATGKAAG
jgi:hypothetical protein